jgi:hypothetical protein
VEGVPSRSIRPKIHPRNIVQFCEVDLLGSRSYKIIYSGVDENPEIAWKCLKRMVGANGFEPSTSWSRISSRNTILLARLALFCVKHPHMGRYSAAIGLKSDSTIWKRKNACHAQPAMAECFVVDRNFSRGRMYRFGSRPNACAKVLKLYRGICRSSGRFRGVCVSDPRRSLLRKADYSSKRL